MRRFLISALAVFIAFFIQTYSAHAWGKFGHLTVCDLAYRNLTDTSKEALKELFREGKGGITIEGRDGVVKRYYTSYNLGCLEEDAFPRKHPKDHFINVPRDTKSITNGQCPAQADCILSGIQRDADILKDTSNSDEDRVFALMALGHWIGDIHQPLHVSFADDRGGNRIEVKLTGKCGTSKYRPKELHGVWDNCLLEAGMFERVRKRRDYKKTWSKNTITYRAVDTLLVNTTHSEEKIIVQGNPWQWANESLAITLLPDTRYCFINGENCWYSEQAMKFSNGGEKRKITLEQDYLARFERIAQDRIRKAGFRLAHLVNKALDPNYTEPIQNSTQSP